MPDAPAPVAGAPVDPNDHSVRATDPLKQRIWDHVVNSPIHNLWNLQGVTPMAIVKRTAHSFNEDNLLSRAAELGYYFLFALFPTLLSVSAIFGLVVQKGDLYLKLLNYLALVVPRDAFQMIVEIFTQTTTRATGGKLIFGLVAGVWSASVGFSAIQDTLNIVYKVKETRPYWKVKGAAILVTILLSVILISTLSALAVGTWISHEVRRILAPGIGLVIGVGVHIFFDIVSAAMLVLLFAVIYYYAPDLKNKHWRWFTPGSAVGIVGWFLASIILRIYLHYFNSYSVTYGSLGAVIILLTWFYITGLMLLIGAEINSEIEAAVAECKLKESGVIPEHATSDVKTPIGQTA